MWRSITLALFLLVLAQTAKALPIVDSVNLAYSQTVQSSQLENLTPPLFDSDDEKDLFSLPRINGTIASLFTAEIQTTPNYVLVIEFFEVKHSAGLNKNLVNPPVVINWFEQLSHKAHSSRLSGWKDGNSLYKARNTYHS